VGDHGGAGDGGCGVCGVVPVHVLQAADTRTPLCARTGLTPPPLPGGQGVVGVGEGEEGNLDFDVFACDDNCSVVAAVVGLGDDYIGHVP
jgi:hypothetical protein